jgi:hypothetical protein
VWERGDAAWRVTEQVLKELVAVFLKMDSLVFTSFFKLKTF